MDRTWAVAHDRAKLTEGWAQKINFLRGVTEPGAHGRHVLLGRRPAKP